MDISLACTRVRQVRASKAQIFPGFRQLQPTGSSGTVRQDVKTSCQGCCNEKLTIGLSFSIGRDARRVVCMWYACEIVCRWLVKRRVLAPVVLVIMGFCQFSGVTCPPSSEIAHVANACRTQALLVQFRVRQVPKMRHVTASLVDL